MDENLKQTDETGNKGKRKAKKGWKQELKEWVAALASALIIVFILQSFLFCIIRVEGQSMETTLHDGERLFVNVAGVKFSQSIPRNSIVICHYPNRSTKLLGIIPIETNFVKRLVAVPGDQVYRKNGVTHVVYEEDGQRVDVPMDERLEQYFPNGSPEDYDTYTLGENEYFAVGDNRYNSHDSRDWRDNDDSNDVGPITKDMVVGRVQQVLWPLNSFRAAK